MLLTTAPSIDALVFDSTAIRSRPICQTIHSNIQAPNVYLFQRLSSPREFVGGFHLRIAWHRTKSGAKRRPCNPCKHYNGKHSGLRKSIVSGDQWTRHVRYWCRVFLDVEHLGHSGDSTPVATRHHFVKQT